MKSIKFLWGIVASLAVALGISLLVNLKVQNNVQNTQKPTNNERVVPVLELSQIEMTLVKDWSLPDGVGLLKLTFMVKNLSKEPQVITIDDLSVFDCNDCLYTVSTSFNTKFNPLLYAEMINPNTSKELAVVFEVPEDELYCIGMSDKLVRSGRQAFVDQINEIQCEFENFEEMNKVRIQISKEPSRFAIKTWNWDNDDEMPYPAVEGSVFDSLFREGTNPDNEIEVDLNDYITSDRKTDWNHTELCEGSCQELLQQGIYYSKSKDAWVKERSN